MLVGWIWRSLVGVVGEGCWLASVDGLGVWCGFWVGWVLGWVGWVSGVGFGLGGFWVAVPQVCAGFAVVGCYGDLVFPALLRFLRGWYNIDFYLRVGDLVLSW